MSDLAFIRRLAHQSTERALRDATRARPRVSKADRSRLDAAGFRSFAAHMTIDMQTIDVGDVEPSILSYLPGAAVKVWLALHACKARADRGGQPLQATNALVARLSGIGHRHAVEMIQFLRAVGLLERERAEGGAGPAITTLADTTDPEVMKRVMNNLRVIGPGDGRRGES